jgi:excisionase family DNA binding protein
MPPTGDSPERVRVWMTAKDAAAYVQCDPKTIYRACRRRELRHARLGARPGAELRFRREWLDRWLERRAEGRE